MKTISLYLTLLFLLEVRTSNLGASTSENELEDFQSFPVNTKSPAAQLYDEVDILKLINVTAKDPGVSLVEGPVKNFPAYKFRMPFGNVPLMNSSSVTKAMSSDVGFTTVFLYRQQKNNLATLLSVNSPGRLTPWFQISSNSRTGVLSLRYRTNISSKLFQKDWSLPHHHRKSTLAAWTWLSISADFSTGTLRLDLDCQPSKFEFLDFGKEQGRIKVPRDALVYFRQEPGRKKKFLGSMQVAKVLPYTKQERLWSCLHISDHQHLQHLKPIH